jgi:hypothetical protein
MKNSKKKFSKKITIDFRSIMGDDVRDAIHSLLCGREWEMPPL